MTYRILTLDGGGAWALIEVRALIALFGETATGHDVLAAFDMVAANSGGSIVLAGLVEDMALSDLVALFKTESMRRSIFSPTKNIADSAVHALLGFGPKYSAAAKLPALERLMPKTGDLPMTQAATDVAGPGGQPVHLLIVGFDYDRNAASFFRSAATTGWGHGAPTTLTLAGAVHASTNAPVSFFDGPAEIPGSSNRYWDGGLTGNNNPALAACVEAVTLGQAPADLRVLSIGTATVRLPLADPGAAPSPYLAPRSASSLTSDLAKLATSILDDPPDFATFVVYTLTGGGAGLPPNCQSRLVRLNPLISPSPSPGGGWTAPAGWTAAQFQYICQMAMDAVEQNDVEYIDDWCSLWMMGGAPNQPIRMDGQTLACEIGDPTYAAAVASWRALTASPVA